MAIANSKLSAKGQISMPARIRKKLGIGLGSVLEWYDKSGEVVVRKTGRHTSTDVHDSLFGERKPKRNVNIKEAILTRMRRRHARG